jgi:hypothetical protein
LHSAPKHYLVDNNEYERVLGNCKNTQDLSLITNELRFFSGTGYIVAALSAPLKEFRSLYEHGWCFALFSLSETMSGMME